jgi:hypothetical protein
VHNTTQRIEHLEGSIATVQGALDNAQRVLAVADKTGKKVDAVAANMRRTGFVLAGAGALLIVFAVLRRREAA